MRGVAADINDTKQVISETVFSTVLNGSKSRGRVWGEVFLPVFAQMRLIDVIVEGDW